MTTCSAISADLSALDAHVSALQERADNLALAAVANEGDARQSLAALLREIEQAKAERSIFLIAMGQAQAREDDAQRATDAAARDQHRADARSIASRIVEAGKRADEIIDAYVGIIQALDEDERALHRAMRAAGEPMSPGIHGAFNIAALANERMRATCEGRLNRLSDQRSMSIILSAAMADLTEATTHD